MVQCRLCGSVPSNLPTYLSGRTHTHELPGEQHHHHPHPHHHPHMKDQSMVVQQSAAQIGRVLTRQFIRELPPLHMDHDGWIDAEEM